MSFERPTLAELVDRVESDFVSRLNLAGAVLRRSMVYVFARVVAGAVHMLHGHLDWNARQLFPDSSDAAYLERQANVFGISRTAAVFAQVSVTFPVEDPPVPTPAIPAGTVLIAEDGAEYTVDEEVPVPLDEATVTGTATAVVAGAEGTREAGDFLQISTPAPGINSSDTVVAESLIDGADEEETEALRARFLSHLREPPQGGAEHDYEAWALEVAGVTRAWVYPNENGLGTVVVRFVRDEDVSIFPSAGEVTEVQDHIDEESPITAEVTVEAPTDSPVAFTLSITPDTTDTRDAVEAELTDLLRREAAPGDGVTSLGTVLLSDIETAVRQATGITDRVVTVPAADVVPALGALSTLGTITWV